VADLTGIHAPVSDEALKQLKFAELLPPALAASTLSARAADDAGCAAVLKASVVGPAPAAGRATAGGSCERWR